MFDTIPTVADRDDALELLRLMRCPTTTDRIDMLAAELATRRAAAERAGRDGAIEAVKSVANDVLRRLQNRDCGRPARHPRRRYAARRARRLIDRR